MDGAYCRIAASEPGLAKDINYLKIDNVEVHQKTER
jgi:hypothetical protein